MSPVLFWIFSALMLGFGLAVIFNRNPVASALCLVASFLGLAGLFISLDAYFIGIIQVLVYAGAVMVLFLFIIMLLDVKKEKRRDLNPAACLGGGVVALGFVGFLLHVVNRYEPGMAPFPPLGNTLSHFDDARQIGDTLFSHYNFPFQVIGVLILVATIGVVVLSKRELK